MWIRNQGRTILMACDSFAVEDHSGKYEVITSSYTTDGKWELEKRVKLRKCKVVAWMPLPKQYKEKENDIR